MKLTDGSKKNIIKINIIKSRSFSEFIPSSVLFKFSSKNKIGNLTIYKVKIKSLCGYVIPFLTHFMPLISFDTP